MKVICVQTNPDSNLESNISKLDFQMQNIETAPRRTGIVVLPEVFAVMGSDELRKESASALGEGLFKKASEWARQLGYYLVAGSHAESADDETKVFNTATAFDPHGRLLNVYRKVHLFNLRDSNGVPLYCESDVFLQGKDTSTFTIHDEGENWRCMTIVCYDLRFPEIVRREISRSGAIDILFVPAAFTHQTGKDHWEVLLRARAIENQCYVVACNQTGYHTEGRKRNWGHSMIIDPWGHIVTSAEEAEGIISAEITKEAIQNSRVRIPSLTDRVFVN
ncbi:MAG: hypothetical protein RJB13_1500 [Pseudomonadota bacterium]